MWIFATFGSALMESIGNAVSHSVHDRWSIETIAWWQRLAAALVTLLVALVWRGGLPDLPGWRYWLPAAISVVINTATTLWYIRALREPLSLTVPITALSPVFLLATEPLMTGRFVPLAGMGCVAVIAFGVYMLNLPALRTHGLLGPFKSLWRERGPKMMLCVVACWAVTAPLDRMAIDAGDPLWYAATLNGGISLLLTPIILRRSRKSGISWRGGWRLGGLGLLSGCASTMQMCAMSVAPVTYVIALRRFSAPLTTLWSRLFFDEPHFYGRLLGTVIMTVGAVLLLLSL